MDATQIDRATTAPRRLPDHIDPSRAWILGIVIEEDGTATGMPVVGYADSVGCQCLDDCPIDHENA